MSLGFTTLDVLEGRVGRAIGFFGTTGRSGVHDGLDKGGMLTFLFLGALSVVAVVNMKLG